MAPPRRPGFSSVGSRFGSVEADENSRRTADASFDESDENARRYSVPRPVGWWQMRNGMWIEFRRMSDSHLRNVLNILSSRQNSGLVYNEAYGELSRRQGNSGAEETQIIEESRRINERRQVEMVRGAVSPVSPDGGNLRVGNTEYRTASIPMIRDQIVAVNPGVEVTPTPPLPNRPRRIKE